MVFVNLWFIFEKPSFFPRSASIEQADSGRVHLTFRMHYRNRPLHIQCRTLYPMLSQLMSLPALPYTAAQSPSQEVQVHYLYSCTCTVVHIVEQRCQRSQPAVNPTVAISDLTSHCVSLTFWEILYSCSKGHGVETMKLTCTASHKATNY